MTTALKSDVIDLDLIRLLPSHDIAVQSNIGAV